MITVGMSTLVEIRRARVWRALTDPAEVVRWRPGAFQLLDAAENFPCPGESVRWRARIMGLPVIVCETTLALDPGERLESRMSLGLFRFDETFSLATEEGDPRRTRLGLKIATSNQMPVVGGALDRFAVRRFASQLASTYLHAIRDWCEWSDSPEVTGMPAPVAGSQSAAGATSPGSFQTSVSG